MTALDLPLDSVFLKIVRHILGHAFKVIGALPPEFAVGAARTRKRREATVACFPKLFVHYTLPKAHRVAVLAYNPGACYTRLANHPSCLMKTKALSVILARHREQAATGQMKVNEGVRMKRHQGGTLEFSAILSASVSDPDRDYVIAGPNEEFACLQETVRAYEEALVAVNPAVDSMSAKDMGVADDGYENF